MFERFESQDKTIDLVPDGRHELLNHNAAERVMATVLSWIAQRLSDDALLS